MNNKYIRISVVWQDRSECQCRFCHFYKTILLTIQSALYRSMSESNGKRSAKGQRDEKRLRDRRQQIDKNLSLLIYDETTIRVGVGVNADEHG
jgi:hypothetical protein